MLRGVVSAPEALARAQNRADRLMAGGAPP
jgi:hypothetical protein